MPMPTPTPTMSMPMPIYVWVVRECVEPDRGGRERDGAKGEGEGEGRGRFALRGAPCAGAMRIQVYLLRDGSPHYFQNYS